jgi:hypothetical protein
VSLFVDDLDARHNLGGLVFPGPVGEKSAMHENRVDVGLIMSDRHAFQKVPIDVPQLREHVMILLFQEGRIPCAAVLAQPELVVAQQGDNAATSGDFEDALGIRPAIDEIAKQDDPVGWGDVEELKQRFELLCAAVDVSDGDGAGGHEAALRKC